MACSNQLSHFSLKGAASGPVARPAGRNLDLTPAEDAARLVELFRGGRPARRPSLSRGRSTVLIGAAQ